MTGVSSRVPTGPSVGAHPEYEEGIDEEEDDEDLFSFQPPPPGTVPHTPAPTLPPTAVSPPSAARLSDKLSPAAAYALAARHGVGAPPTGVREVNLPDGTKRRKVFSYPESPTYGGDADPFPYGGTHGLQHQQTEIQNGYKVSHPRSPVIELESKMNSARTRGAFDDGMSINSAERKIEVDAHGMWSAPRTKSSLAEMYYNGDDGISVPPTTGMSYDPDLLAEEEDSPYPEVRASVSNIDDPEMPCLTFRSWFVGIVFCTACGMANTFFQLRYPRCVR